MSVTHLSGPLNVGGVDVVNSSGALIGGTLAAGSVTSTALAANSVTTSAITNASVTPTKTIVSQSVTATADGTGAGQIATTANMVTVTSDNADKIITLPVPEVGKEIWIRMGTTGYELRTSAPATIGINGGTGANAESAIPASTVVIMRCVSSTNWIGSTFTSAGVVGVVEVAA